MASISPGAGPACRLPCGDPRGQHGAAAGRADRHRPRPQHGTIYDAYGLCVAEPEPGLYELLVTERLKAELGEIADGFPLEFAPFEQPEARTRIALHLKRRPEAAVYPACRPPHRPVVEEEPLLDPWKPTIAGGFRCVRYDYAGDVFVSFAIPCFCIQDT